MKAHILIVDDDPRITDLLRRILAYEGYSVAIAATGNEALNRTLERPPDINVLDIMLRSIHGVQTRVAEAACHDADVVLRPWACDAKWHDFAHPGKYIALGRKTAEEQLSELKSLAKQKAGHDPDLGKKRMAVTA